MSNTNPMNFDGELSPADLELETAFRGVRPAPIAVSRDNLLYEAGRRSTRRPLLFWRSASAALAVLTVAVAMSSRPARIDRIEIVRQPTPSVIPTQMAQFAAAPGAHEGEAFAYIQLRSRVLAEGVDSLSSGKLTAEDAVIPDLRPVQLQ